MITKRRNIVHMVEGFLLAGVIGASLLVAAGASADDRPEAEIRVRVIHAWKGEKKVDPKVADLQKFMEPFAYTSSKQVIDESIRIQVGDTRGLGLLKGKNLNVTLEELTKDKATIKLLLLGQTGKMVDTVVSAGPHKLFFLAGPQYDGGVLFIAIEPHYDPEKIGVQDVGALEKKKTR